MLSEDFGKIAKSGYVLEVICVYVYLASKTDPLITIAKN